MSTNFRRTQSFFVELDHLARGDGQLLHAPVVPSSSVLVKAAWKLQGHRQFQELPIAIENKKGTIRRGEDPNGKPWKTTMVADYGFVKGTKGADGDEYDVYIGPHSDATHAHVVHQRTHDGKKYDEDKAILGVKNKEEAKKLFLAHYDSPKFLGPIKRVPMERFKELMQSKKPLVKVSAVAFFQELGDIFEAGV